MKTFYLRAKLTRQVEDEVELTVKADSEQEAFSKAEELFQTYPHEVYVDDVDRVLVTYRRNEPPSQLEIWNAREDQQLA